MQARTCSLLKQEGVNLPQIVEECVATAGRLAVASASASAPASASASSSSSSREETATVAAGANCSSVFFRCSFRIVLVPRGILSVVPLLAWLLSLALVLLLRPSFRLLLWCCAGVKPCSVSFFHLHGVACCFLQYFFPAALHYCDMSRESSYQHHRQHRHPFDDLPQCRKGSGTEANLTCIVSMYYLLLLRVCV